MFRLGKTQIFSIDDTALKHRLQLLAYFALIATVAWLVMSVHYWSFRQYILPLVCLFASVASATTLFLCIYRPASQPIIVHLFVLSNVLALCATSAVSWGTHSQDALYYPIIVFITAQLVGYRWALVWSLPIILFSILTYFQSVGLSEIVGAPLDRLIHSIAATLTALWISYETERFSNRRKLHLVNLTEKLQEKTRQLELAEETAGVGHWRWDANTNTVSLSDEAYKICALTKTATEPAVVLRDFIAVWDSRYHTQLSEAFAEECASSPVTNFRLDLSYAHASGFRFVNCRGICERDDSNQVVGIFGTLRDDTELQLVTDRLTVKAKELDNLARYDPLTGLANRYHFQQHLDSQIARAASRHQQIALLVLDMDGFKEINDSLGHIFGDKVLKVVADRLTGIVRESDLVARLGGDEFTIIVGEMNDEKDIYAISQSIVKTVAKPITIDGHVLSVGVSVGGSIYPKDSRKSGELLAFSDTAMYKAKANKSGVALYSAHMTEELLSRRATENRLRGALERDEFHLMFQPQADIGSGMVTGYECLIRWHGDGNSMMPLEFIPLLESSGEIIDVGRWVLEKACQQVVRWQEDGHALTVAVNISPVQFREENFVNRTVDIVKKYDIDPAQLKFEITEGLLIHDLEEARNKLSGLKNHGLKISVDDFGTGYSSLAYLKDLPIDQLKIDRAFIKDIPDKDTGTIASSIILLGQNLGLEVIAEGVETQDQLDFLNKHACHAYQGYLLGRPMAVDRCITHLDRVSSG